MRWAGLLAAVALAALPGPALAQQAGAGAASQFPGRYPYTEADVQFVTGMIHHHAQAIVMARWAPSHGAGPSIRVLCERIVNAQGDEITLMQDWLRDRHQPVPEVSLEPGAWHQHGGHGAMLMPGMLTEEQMQQLDQARGAEFDRLFLTFMIQHHQGALVMVDRLFSTPGAGQDEAVYKFASDIYADQSTEIERMQRILATYPPR